MRATSLFFRPHDTTTTGKKQARASKCRVKGGVKCAMCTAQCTTRLNFYAKKKKASAMKGDLI